MEGPVNVFFMGKGGVGKSTSSALYSLSLAKQGYRVALASMDPAHNLADIFQVSLNDKPGRITDGLSVMEIDQEKWIKSYLKGIHQQIRKTYAYLTAFNLDNYLNIIKYSPGLEEYALVLAFEKIRKDFRTHDYVVFDMAPTALSLKFFFLPSLSIIWTDKLLGLRQEIIEKRKLITKIKLIKKEVETDSVLNKLQEQTRYFRDLKKLFQDGEKTYIKLVLNPDKLSFAESERIHEKLGEISIPLHEIILNKAEPGEVPAEIPSLYPGIPVTSVRRSEHSLGGLETLEAFLSDSDICFR